ncbi:hypothetical protein L208DRAFT_1408558 [Tricholoma matsutake]|nr:hypothetical protein L208DRAFT_1408558 [Tricholoma matsutake 945]
MSVSQRIKPSQQCTGIRSTQPCRSQLGLKKMRSVGRGGEQQACRQLKVGKADRTPRSQ